MSRPTSPERGEPRDVAELRRLREAHPELAPAIDLQLGLLMIQRRVAGRIPLPVSLATGPPPRLRQDGRALLRLSDVPMSWTDFRSVFRETADLLAHFGEMTPATASGLIGLARQGERLVPLAESWFQSRVEGEGTFIGSDRSETEADALDQVFGWAFRPFLVRCAEALAPRLALEDWGRSSCPACGGEPEMGILGSASGRQLVCARCTLRWPFSASRCVFCGNDEPSLLTTLASPDRVYQLQACEVCRRYLKAFDERFGGRPALPAFDAVATLPLDAAAVQRGYGG